MGIEFFFPRVDVERETDRQTETETYFLPYGDVLFVLFICD